MDKAVVLAIATWLICWMLDLMAVLAPTLSLVFIVLKLIFVVLAVAAVGHMVFVGRLYF